MVYKGNTIFPSSIINPLSSPRRVVDFNRYRYNYLNACTGICVYIQGGTSLVLCGSTHISLSFSYPRRYVRSVSLIQLLLSFPGSAVN